MGTRLDPAAIRELAYRLWVGRGRPEGAAQQDWFEAERRLASEQQHASKAVDEAVKESFPASDAPASGLPDKPPANADAKWAAAAKTRKRRPKSAVTAGLPESERKRAPGAEVPKVGSRDAPGG